VPASQQVTGAQAWLRVFRLPAYAPDLNPVEGIWSVLKRGVLANLAAPASATWSRSSGTA
jgi:transposase